MAKATESDASDGGAAAVGALEWAAGILRARFDEVLKLREAALTSDDIEAVHEMRVATRRLRSAIRSFTPLFDKKAFRRPQKDLKRIADALGAARDQDVALAALGKLQKKSKKTAIREGIGRLIDDRRTLRETAAPGLAETLTEENLDKAAQRFAAALAKISENKDARARLTVNEAGRTMIGARLTEFCALSDALYAPFRVKPLHALRIAAKRLRYTIELFVDVRGAALTPFAKEIAEMQSYLGEIHDADAWIAGIGRRLRKNAGDPSTDLLLMSEFVKDRTKNYRGAVKLWGKWQAAGFTEKLREAIS